MPHQCAHWLAMTCRRQKGVSGCKDAARNAMQKEGRVRGCKDAARKVRGNMPGVSGCKGVLPSEFVDRYDFALSTASRFVALQEETDCRVAVHPPRSSQ